MYLLSRWYVPTYPLLCTDLPAGCSKICTNFPVENSLNPQAYVENRERKQVPRICTDFPESLWLRGPEDLY